MLPFAPDLALIAVPMAVYLYALGLLHGGKHPRVVSGTADLAWLLLSLSGLVAFGPVGQLVVRRIFGPAATPLGWAVWLMGLAVTVWLVARTGRHRVVLYHVPRDATRPALSDALPDFRPTLPGFEDPATGQMIVVREYHLTRTAVVDAQGPGARATLTQLRPNLRKRFSTVEPPASALATVFFLLAGGVMLVPVIGWFVREPGGQRLVRTISGWLGQ